MSTGPAGAITSGVAPPQQQLSAATGFAPKGPPNGDTVEQTPPTGSFPAVTPQQFQGPGTVQEDENGNLIRLLQQGGPLPTSVSQEQANAIRDFSGTGGGLDAVQGAALNNDIFNQPVGLPPAQNQFTGGLLNSQPFRVQPDRIRGLIR